MAKDSAVMDAPEIVTNPALPERQTLSAMEAHQRDKERRKKEFEKVRPILAKCVDPDVAARYERQKPRFMFKVDMTVMERDVKTKKFRDFRELVEVEAQTEDEAWARACDTVRRWPNRRTTDHKITNIGSAA